MSTGKVTAFLWTVIVVYIILTMALILGAEPDKYPVLIHSISPMYVVLLGGPFAAAVLAKGIVSGAVDDKTAQRPSAEKAHVADVFSNDDGDTDLVDTQYLVFNLVVAIIVIVQFARAPGLGAPQIPDFLASLTGVSAATYVANKATVTGNNSPSIDQVVPLRARPGAEVVLYGKNLRAQGDPANAKVTVLVGPSMVEARPESPTKVVFRLPENAAPDGVPVPITVLTNSGLVTPEGKTITVVPDEIKIVRVGASTVAEGGRLTLIGSGFIDASDVDASGTRIEGPQVDGNDRIRVSLTPEQLADPPAEPQLCQVAPGTEFDNKITVEVPVGLGTQSPNRRFVLGAERGALRAVINPPIVVTVL